MQRPLLSETQIHPEALKAMTSNYSQVVQEVMEAVKSNKTVIVGMSQNPIVKKAKKVLSDKNIPFTYLEYGNYFSQWKPRLAIKLWSGWPTYPQVFIDGKLIGGCSELEKFLKES